MISRNDDFVRCIRNIKNPSDASEIECTDFTGGGIRFVGFNGIKARKFLAVMQKYGKRAIFRLAQGNETSMYADCYDNIEPKQLTACSVQELNSATPELKLTRSCSDYTCGAVVYSSYICSAITSEAVSRLLLPANVLDVNLKPTSLTLLSVSKTSTTIVGGLQSQLETAVRGRMHGLTHNRPIKFAANAPSVCGKKKYVRKHSKLNKESNFLYKLWL
jgi:hypothetical protein